MVTPQTPSHICHFTFSDVHAPHAALFLIPQFLNIEGIYTHDPLSGREEALLLLGQPLKNKHRGERRHFTGSDPTTHTRALR